MAKKNIQGQKNLEAPQPPKVLVYIEGGLIQDVSTNQPVEVIVIDYEKDGDPDEMITIAPFDKNHREADYYVNDWGTIEPTPEYIEHYFNEARKEKPKPKKEEPEEDEGAFIILDTWGEIAVCIDEEGKVLRFENEKAAYEYGQELQSFQVVQLEH